MRNYIKFYLKNNILMAEIHKQGKYKIINNEEDVQELIRIARRYGHIIKGECILKENFFSITRNYEEYINNKKKPLYVIGSILPNMKLSKKSKIIGKTLVTASLTAVLLSNGINAITDNSANAIPPNETNQEQTLSEDELKDIEYTPEEADEVYYEIDSTKQNEVKTMLQKNEFHFSYENRCYYENMTNAKRYEDLFEKYANYYGLDKNLLMALSAQESGGEHFDNLDNGPAEGIMQIEKIPNMGSVVSTYNFETGQEDSIAITRENLQDLETNIQIGSIILRNSLINNNFNVPLALQTYNFGPGNMESVLSTCSSIENIDENDLRNNSNSTEWLNYREFLGVGDPQYIEHVFSYLDNETPITILDDNGKPLTLTIINDYEHINQI